MTGSRKEVPSFSSLCLYGFRTEIRETEMEDT